MPHNPASPTPNRGQSSRDIAGGASRPVRLSTGRFIGRFAVLIACFYAVTMWPWFRERLFPANLHANAVVSAWVLQMMGEQATCEDQAIVSPRFALEVRRGCEALEPAALFVAAVLAFPAVWRSRLIGIAIGVVALLVLNILRIISLYYAGVFAPSMFETLHLEVWQTLFVISAMGLWLVWAWKASGADIRAHVDSKP